MQKAALEIRRLAIVKFAGSDADNTSMTLHGTSFREKRRKHQSKNEVIDLLVMSLVRKLR